MNGPGQIIVFEGVDLTELKVYIRPVAGELRQAGGV